MSCEKGADDIIGMPSCERLGPILGCKNRRVVVGEDSERSMSKA